MRYTGISGIQQEMPGKERKKGKKITVLQKVKQ